MPRFLNPYNFVYAPKRPRSGTSLDDAKSPGHAAYAEGRWSGRITVRLTTRTPLLIPDAARSTKGEGGHRTYGTRLGLDRRPLLSPTSLKGMLRSAYETITNSRFGIWNDHDLRLGYRMPAAEGLSLVPARIEAQGIHLLLGETRDLPEPTDTGWRSPDNLLYAAWVGAYRGFTTSFGIDLRDLHQKRVWAYIRKWRHITKHFRFWNVEAIRADSDRIPNEITHAEFRAIDGETLQPVDRTGKWVRGWLCVTNRNINGKHHERLFFAANDHPLRRQLHITMTAAEYAAMRAQWRDVVSSYRDAHQPREILRTVGDRVADPWEYLGDDPGDTAWSPHVYQAERLELNEGTLCYASVRRDATGRLIVDAVYPVSIARKIFECTPSELLDKSLAPASDQNLLSPADRVFGWANSEGQGAAKGLVRLSRVRCNHEDAVTTLRPPLRLSILSKPKPQQAKFYTVDGDTRPLAGQPQASGYARGTVPRGRKVYPHQQTPSHYWAPDGPPLPTGRRREYRSDEHGSQNWTMTSWVRIGAEFDFDLDVTNLDDVELGALLYSLDLPAEHCHRQGAAKPLGFGSVTLGVTAVDLATGESWRDRYAAGLTSSPNGDAGRQIGSVGDLQWTSVLDVFRQAIANTYGPGDAPLALRFSDVSFIEEFLIAARGHGDDIPVHYPRHEGENYEWFVQNERTRKHALPRLNESDPSLPKDPRLPFLA